MKSYVILFVATLMLVRPLWPIAEYVMNYDYIVNVLCENKDRPAMHCDGKCYLAKQLAKESERGDKNPFGENRSKTEIQQIVFFEPLHPMDVPIDFQDEAPDNFKTSRAFIPTLLTSDIAHPPEVA
ncbi:hypothetical protein LCGC14_1330640 [marine sediment metagenome]|uniref:Uncharacterized protein n=2 Tax=root TaxID=1 RepID=A0A831QMG0_9FLAO|nr:hypothetical protein [Pricia antarctica]